jgi:hypothetical protein
VEERHDEVARALVLEVCHELEGAARDGGADVTRLTHLRGELLAVAACCTDGPAADAALAVEQIEVVLLR